MSTDYKIGIVVGLVVLIAGIVYFIVSSDEKPISPPVTETATAPNTVVPTPENPPAETPTDVTTPTEISLDTPAPSTQPAVVTPTEATAPSTPAATGWQLDSDADSATAAEAPPTEAPAEKAGSEVVKIRVTPEATEEGFELSEDADAAWNEPDPEPVIRPIQRPAETATAEVGGTGGTYVVKKGDNGLWMIAERVYGLGNGKYWTLIQKANPNARTSALREGQMLKIPPLPAIATQTPEAASTTETRAEFGRVTPGTDGNRVYVVEEGEAGLWGVAEKVYDGKGHLWEHIQKANPGVKPSALRPGMKLIIPPLPTSTRPGAVAPGTTATTAAGATTTRRRGEVFTENDRQYYIVQSGDKGYWGIARKVYSDGKYSYLIDRANPGVDSFSLQPGDKLEVPPIPKTTAGRTQPAPRRATRPARRAPVSDGEPDFGP